MGSRKRVLLRKINSLGWIKVIQEINLYNLIPFLFLSRSINTSFLVREDANFS